MKKFLYWSSLLTFLFITPSLSWAAPPLPARIGGSVTVDDTVITADTDSGYTFEIKKEDGTSTEPAASDIDGLSASNIYLLDIPIYDASDQPGGVNPGDTVIMHVYHNDVELFVISPENGEITVGEAGSSTTENIVAFSPKTLTIQESVNGSTDPAAGSYSYTYNTEVELAATPDSGYFFSNWTGDVSNGSSPTTTIIMDGDQTVSANFSECQYTLTMAVNDPQMGGLRLPETGIGESLRACGSQVSIQAIPAEGYYFVGWTGDAVADPAAASTTVTMDGDKAVTANFTVLSYILTVEPSSNGTITLSPETQGNIYGQGEVISVTATPAAGYSFSGWTGDLVNAESASTTITMNEDKTIGAAFVICTQTLTMAVNDPQRGSTSPAVGENIQSCDESVTITATPASGYSFLNWSGDVEDINSPTTAVTMDTDKTVTANFVATTHILTIGFSANGSATLSPEAEGNEYGEDAVVTITAFPATGWVFSSWTGDVADSSLATTTVIIDEDKTVTPVFLPDTDGDGSSDIAEQGPDGTDTDYDGDGDGIADSAQANVVSGGNPDGTYYVTIVTDTSNRLNVTPVASPAAEPSGVTLDYGYFDIYVSGLATGGATTVDIILPDDAPIPDTYYKYGPTPDESSSHWYEFLYDEGTETGAEFDGNLITLHFVDGLRGDGDLTANGNIDDPGAPGRIDVVADDDSKCFISTSAYDSNLKHPLLSIITIAGFFLLMIFGFIRYCRD